MHGLGSNLNYYGAMLDHMPQLQQTHRIVRFDFDGAGQSIWSGNEEKPLSIETLAEDVVDLMDLMKIEHAIMVGHSMSGVRTFFLSYYRYENWLMSAFHLPAGHQYTGC